MLRKNFLYFVITTLFLSGCGSNLKCNQDGLASKLDNDLFNTLASNSYQQTAIFWRYSFLPRSKIEIRDIKDLGLSENRKQRFCEASVSILMPQPNPKSIIEYRPFLLSYKAGLGMGSDPITAGNELLNGDETPLIVGHTYRYTVSEVEDPSSKGEDLVELDDTADYVRNFVNPIMYRMTQVAISDYVSFKPGTGTDKANKDRFEKFISFFRAEVKKASSISEQEKSIRLCTIEAINNKSRHDAYAGFLLMVELLNKNILGKMMFNEKSIQEWAIYNDDQRKICMGGSSSKDSNPDRENNITESQRSSIKSRQNEIENSLLTDSKHEIAQEDPYSNLSESEYVNLIAKLVGSHKQYPKIAQMRGWQGTAEILISINRSGQLTKSEIKQSSGYEVLDKQALEIVKKAAPFPPMPRSISAEEISLHLPYSFHLE